MSTDHKARLMTAHDRVVNNMDPTKVLRLLLSDGVLNHDEVEKIKLNATSSEQVERLMTLLARKPDPAFSALVRALQETNQDGIASIILGETAGVGIVSSTGICSSSTTSNNEQLKAILRLNMAQIVKEIDPTTSIMDYLVGESIMSEQRREQLMLAPLRTDKCRAMLAEVLNSSHPSAGIVLARAIKDGYLGLATKMGIDRLV